MIRIALVLIGIAVAPFILAESSTSIGSTDAVRCFEESRVPLSALGLKYCDNAIRKEDMTRRDLAATYSNRGIIRSNTGSLGGALDDHNKAIELMPDMGQAYVNRGNVHYHMRDFEAALADFETATRLGASPAYIPHLNRGLTLIKLNRKEEARNALETALSFAPGSKKIQSRLDALTEL